MRTDGHPEMDDLITVCVQVVVVTGEATSDRHSPHCREADIRATLMLVWRCVMELVRRKKKSMLLSTKK